MPQQVLPSQEKFNLFEQYMLNAGFKRLSDIEFSTRLGLAPRPRKGREVGFVFSANKLTVKVWTTFLAEEGRAREEDAGWVVISDGDKPNYYSHPIMRTKGFLRRLYRSALIAKERAINRPICPNCSAYMKIAMGNGLKSRYWFCWSKEHINQIEQLPWDCGLSAESIKILRAERRIRERYRRQRESTGKTVGQAMLARKPWPRESWQRTQLVDRT